MQAYLLIGYPLFIYLWWSVFGKRTLSYNESFTLILLGILLSLPCYIVHTTAKTLIGQKFYATHIYFYYLFFDNILVLGFGLAFSWLFVSKIRETVGRECQTRLMFILTGFYLLFSITESITYINKYDIYILFLLPTIRILLILAVSTLFAYFREGFGLWKLFYIFLCFFSGFLTATVSFFYHLYFRTIAISILVFLFCVIIAVMVYLTYRLDQPVAVVEKPD